MAQRPRSLIVIAGFAERATVTALTRQSYARLSLAGAEWFNADASPAYELVEQASLALVVDKQMRGITENLWRTLLTFCACID
jgi:hypothetical protein